MPAGGEGFRPIVALDDQRLERARTQWQLGDWRGLARMALDDIADHPDRARLALLAAAGHQQAGDLDQARRFSRQALDWGCSRRLLSQVMIAGVHNTLGRAHALLDPDGERSRLHFEASIAVAQPGQDLSLLPQLRASRELATLGLEGPTITSPGPADAGAAAASAPAAHGLARADLGPLESTVGSIADRLQALDKAWRAALDELRADQRQLAREFQARLQAAPVSPPQPLTAPLAWQQALDGLHARLDGLAEAGPRAPGAAGAPDKAWAASLRQDLERSLKRELAEAVRRLLAQHALSHFMVHGRLPPGLQGWPVSADLGVLLIETLQAEPFDAVVEFGSGVSTLLMAKALRQAGAGGRASPRQLAIEHLERFRDQTQALLREHELADRVNLVHCPLAPTRLADGSEVAYYDADRPLAGLARALADAGVDRPRLFVLVDGPPAATGPQARYPALGALLKAFPVASLHLLMDDYARADEQQVLQRWVRELEAGGRTVVVEPLALERGACWLKVESPA